MKKRLLMVSALAGLIAFAIKSSSKRRDEWHGLSEEEVRAKLEEKLPDRVPEDKRTAIADKVVSKMREKGVIGDTDADEVVDVSDSIELDEDQAEPAST